MNATDILAVFARAQAIITNSHVVYTSGRHGTAYVNKDAIYPDTHATSMLCLELARRFASNDVEVVIAPAVGGVILSQWTAHHLSQVSCRAVSVYADKSGDDFVIKRGYDKLVNGKNVLVVEDVLTTGGSVKKVVEAVRAIGGNVVGLGVLCNRGEVTSHDVGEVPILTALVNVKFESWPEDVCPLCKAGVPVNTDVGKGKEFLARQLAA